MKDTYTRLRPLSKSLLATVLTVFAVATPVSGAQPQHSAISDAVRQFLENFHEGRLQVGQRIEVSVGYIDPRLNLPPCDSDLSTTLNGSQQGLGKLQVKVSCQGSQPWTKYVGAEVSLFASVLVATENIRRGTLIEARHLRFMETNLALLRRTPVDDKDLVIGMELKYPLTSGSPFSLEGLSRPVLVERGDLVQLLAETNNLRIRQQGEALQDGALGKVINVRNNSSEMVIQAEVIGTGRVKVQL
ncbi:MAG: flagellar basal body P-ring formation chaperone FlgA [Pseudohongiellaceae bacterium]